MSTMDVFRLIVIYKVLCLRYRCLIIVVNAHNGHWFRTHWYILQKLSKPLCSSPALFKAINPDSIIERAVQVYLEDFQDIAEIT